MSEPRPAGSALPSGATSTPAISLREALFPDFDPARVVYEDEWLIAVDKPDGVSSQAADPERPDDVVHRLRRFLAARGGQARPYLGIHQRLDEDTSGVLLYARDKRANASLARQFEGRAVEKRYVAVVSGWTGGARTLSHNLARGRDGTTVVVDARARSGKHAVTHVEVLSRREDRALLELRIETGRTHQIRAQLAAVGAPVLGDRLYGGAPAPRLMLHARSLGLVHPVEESRLLIEAPPPASFEDALEGRDDALSPAGLRDRLARAMERRWGLARAADHDEDATDAFRLVNEAGDGLPGLAVDVYGDWLVAHVYDDAVEARQDDVMAALDALGFRGVYLKRRPRQANVIVDGRDERLAPSLPVAGEPAPDPLVVREHGLPYRVRLGEGLSTGIFLDQRENRRRVRALSSGARVLNLFAYTCPFTVAAIAGGAASTTSVDASKRLLDWGRENVAGVMADDNSSTGDVSIGDAHRFVAADVFDTLRSLDASGARFDLVCLDPPTYSKTKSSRWKSGRDWVRLAELALRVLDRNGKLLCCSNDRRMSAAAFRRYLHDAARAAAVDVQQLKELPCPKDFPPVVGGEPHLKSLLCTIR